MIRKLVVGTVLVVMASIMVLFAAGSAFAANPTGTGPDQALAPGGDWQPLTQGTMKWYAFQYSGDSSQIQVWLDAVPANGATFSVWTPQEVQNWTNGMAVDPIGRGSTDSFRPGTLSWSGNFNMPGTYYVVVEQSGPQTTYYFVNVSGAGVTIQASAPATTETATAAATAVMTATTATTPTPAATAATTTTPAATAATTTTPAATAAMTVTTVTTTTAVAPAVAAKSGASPDQAFAIPAYSVSVAPGASIWHTFQYAGDQSQIRVWLNDQGQAGLSFSVWTPEQVRQWQAGNTVDPVGRGSFDANAAGDLSWVGSFPQNGGYFVQVTNSSAVDIVYTLSMSGTGVW